MSNKQELARKNIKKKVKLIERWADDGIPFIQDEEGNDLYKNAKPVLYKIPLSVDALRRWSDKDLQITGTNDGAMKSFLSDPTKGKTEDQLEALTNKLKLKKEEQEIVFTKKGLTFWEAKLDLKEKMISNQNEEIGKLLIDNIHLKMDLKDAETKIEDITKQMDFELNALAEKNKKLTARLERTNQIKVIK